MWVRQMVRMMTSTRTRQHLQFWLGGKLGDGVMEEESWFVMRPWAKVGTRPVVMNVPHFQKWAAKFKKARAKGVLDVNMLADVTTKQMYVDWLNMEPEPEVVLADPSKLWGDIWRRVSSGLVGREAFNLVYLLAHNRLGTRERGYRLMPAKYKSDLCDNCKKETETVVHRYATCEWVASLWAYMADLLGKLDKEFEQLNLDTILGFHFRKGKRDGAVTWLLSNYLVFVNQEMVVKGRKPQLCELVGMLRYARTKLESQATKDVGVIQL